MRMKVAKSEPTCSMPTLAKIAVSAAKPADRTAQNCQEASMRAQPRGGRMSPPAVVCAGCLKPSPRAPLLGRHSGLGRVRQPARPLGSFVAAPCCAAIIPLHLIHINAGSWRTAHLRGRGSQGKWHAEHLLGGDGAGEPARGLVPVTGVRTIWSRRPTRASSRSRRSSPRSRATRSRTSRSNSARCCSSSRGCRASRFLSCNSCHNVGTGGVDSLETSIGHGWQRGGRNAPTVLNAVFNVAQFWDGRAEDLKEQAEGPDAGRRSRWPTRERVVGDAERASRTMSPRFHAAPSRTTPTRSPSTTWRRAIEAFEATLITPTPASTSSCDGDDAALTDREEAGPEPVHRQGLRRLPQRHQCRRRQATSRSAWWSSPARSPAPCDNGRFQVTKTADDDYVFSAGPLRNIALTGPYFHSGKVWDLEQAVAVMGVASSARSCSRRGDRHHRVPAHAHRRAATGRVPDPAGQHGDDAAPAS